MNAPNVWWLILCGSVLVFALAVGALFLWTIKRRNERPPVPFKLLRAPGESLRRRLRASDENDRLWFSGAAVLLVLMALGTLRGLLWMAPDMRPAWGFGIVGLVGLTTVGSSGWLLLRRLKAYRNDRLSYLGERAVDEALIPLLSAGYRIFHDIPGEARGARFNIGHVAVGPAGVFAIETRTRRTGVARIGFEAHKVTFDGNQLIWPWKEDDFCITHAHDRARWLGDWLNQMTGLEISPQAVLVLPGWYVVPTGVGSVVVVNHKQLASVIERAPTGVLNEQQIEVIARQLDESCRDVED